VGPGPKNVGSNVLLYQDLFAFEKNFSMLFFAMIFCFVFTTMLITIKISYLFFTWKHFRFLEARGFYAMRNLVKRLRKKQVYELCYSLDLLLSLMYMFSPFFDPLLLLVCSKMFVFLFRKYIDAFQL